MPLGRPASSLRRLIRRQKAAGAPAPGRVEWIRFRAWPSACSVWRCS
ncbi:hypothetical protein [Lysobacter gummosus]